MIDLRKAKPGDLFRRRDGCVVAYVRRYGNCTYQHVVGDIAYTDEGNYYCNRRSTMDIISKARKPRPKPAKAEKDRDAEWLRGIAESREIKIDSDWTMKRLRRIARRLEGTP
jgi:hypothetical protein